MLSVSLRPIPIDFEWNECGVNVMVKVGLMDIERRREMGPRRWLVPVSSNFIGAACTIGRLCPGPPGTSKGEEGMCICGD
jgi:hypothetical protein